MRDLILNWRSLAHDMFHCAQMAEGSTLNVGQNATVTDADHQEGILLTGADVLTTDSFAAAPAVPLTATTDNDKDDDEEEN
jgi:hypothetical protein